MLQRGGNAVDAALATAIALTVVEPTSNGVGSDAFAVIWDGERLTGLNASGRSPAGWGDDRFTGEEMPPVGWDSATVPGAVSAWVTLSERYGKLPFATLFEPAVRYAHDGVLVSPVIARLWANQIERLHDQPGFATTFLPRGRAPLPGELFRNRELATTLTKIAATRGAALYEGELAEAIERAAHAAEGAMTVADLAAHRCDWVEPIAVEFRGHRVHELPPNGQGIATLVALGVLERCPIAGLAADDAEMLHMQIEALKLGIFDVRQHVADSDHMTIDAASLLDPARLDGLARTIRPDLVNVPAPPSQHRGATVYLAVADASGMMVSYIQSNYVGFGSGVVVPGTGIALNNRASCFVTERGHPNCFGPAKRPLNTIIPGFVTKEGAAVAAFGLMGGTMQPQGHLQLVSRLLASDQNPQAALDAPRWRVEGDELWTETAIPQDAREGLMMRGHQLRPGTSLEFGAGQIIWRLEDGYVAASEGRRDGAAVGF
jgi:gamma-glutamyltranspeptidase/glutathione hydrolase